MSLKDRIRDEIARHGPMPFERFMELALYHPEGGFFGSGSLKSDKAGDFLTSPEVSPLFGETLAVHVARERSRIGDPFSVVEVGAGSGSLLRPLLEKVEVPAMAVEVSPAARAALGSAPGEITVADEMPSSIRGVVIANELVDNLPMALAQRSGGGWRERRVGSDQDDLVFIDFEPRPEVSAWLADFAGDVPDGGWVEAQLAATAWLARVIDELQAGSVVIIDYGDTTEGLLPRRADGTLRTYRAHHLGPHPLDEPGKTDITADVNFSALAAVAESHGARVELQRQDDFLSDLGLRHRLSELREAALSAARDGDVMSQLRIKSTGTEAETLLHPRGLGDFRVLVATV